MIIFFEVGFILYYGIDIIDISYLDIEQLDVYSL